MLVGYARVSKSETQDITAQIQALKAIGCDKIFEEAAIGGRWDRPELDRLLGALQADDVVVVQSLDRLTGSLKDLLFALEKIDKCGAHFRSIAESVDTSGPYGRAGPRPRRRPYPQALPYPEAGDNGHASCRPFGC